MVSGDVQMLKRFRERCPQRWEGTKVDEIAGDVQLEQAYRNARGEFLCVRRRRAVVTKANSLQRRRERREVWSSAPQTALKSRSQRSKVSVLPQAFGSGGQRL